jgi:hypothetical protein
MTTNFQIRLKRLYIYIIIKTNWNKLVELFHSRNVTSLITTPPSPSEGGVGLGNYPEI